MTELASPLMCKGKGRKTMDLNHLLFEHQKLILRAGSAAVPPSERLAAAARALRIGGLIERYRAARIPGRRVPIPMPPQAWSAHAIAA